MPKRSFPSEDPPVVESDDATTPPPGKRQRVAPTWFEAGAASASWSSVSQCLDPLQTPERIPAAARSKRIPAAAQAASPADRAKLLQHLLAKTQEVVALASGGALVVRGEALEGERIAVWWEGEGRWYTGVVFKAAPCYACGEPYGHSSHYIHYDDKTKKWETLDELGEGWRLLAPAPAPAHGGFAGRSQGDAGAPPVPPAPLGGLSSSDDDDVSSEIEHDVPEPLRWRIITDDGAGVRGALDHKELLDPSPCDDPPSGGWQPWQQELHAQGVRGQSESPGGWTNLSSMVGCHPPDAAALSDMLPAASDSCAQQV